MPYDPKKVNVIVGGAIITGFAEDTFINAERNNPKRSQKVSAKGEVTTNKNADDTGTIKITLDQTSPSNAVLKALYLQDEKFPAVVTDANLAGDIGAGGSQCSIENDPSAEWGAESSDREWVILVDDYDFNFNLNG